EFGLVSKYCAQAGENALWLDFLDRIGIPPQLEIDAPDIVGLAVQQYGLIRMKWWVKPKPALRRKISLHFDVGDQETVAEGNAARLLTQHVTNRRARAVACYEVVG